MRCFLHILRSLDRRAGGPVEAVRQLVPATARLGYRMELATLDAADAPCLRDLETPVRALGPASGRYGFTPRLLPWLRERAREYDGVVVHGLWQYHSLAAWRALGGTELPYFVFTHGMLDPWYKRRHPFKRLKKWAYWSLAEHRVLRDARAVLFTSEEERLLARSAFRRYGCNEAVISYGTAPPGGDPEAQKAAFFEKFPALRGKRLLMFMSRIHPKKGCDLLVEAFAKVLGNAPEWQLAIAGPSEGGTQERLARLARRLGISGRVTFTGMLSGDLKWGALRAGEAFALPSHSENFGIVVAEALACGLPVLISQRVNIWREIAEDGAGLVAPDTLGGTEDLLRRWTELPASQRREMSAKAQPCFARRFHIQQAAAALARVVGSVGKGEQAGSAWEAARIS